MKWQESAAAAVLLLGLKLLLTEGYFSTDLDVHRNWLRVTSQRPLAQWYLDDLNQWTLDYPPLFAYFQLALAEIAEFAEVDPKCLTQVSDYHSPSCLQFMRLSQLATQLFFHLVVAAYYGFYWELHFFLGIILVDNMHFQYNAILYALLIIVFEQLERGQYVLGAISYALLLSAKHIYLYVAPAFALYYVKKLLLDDFRPKTFLLSVLAGLATLLVVFLPFLSIQQLLAIKGRLFPFGRGLVHDYWAPNFWALYYSLDYFLGFLGYYAGLTTRPTLSKHTNILYEPGPGFCSLLTVAALGVYFYHGRKQNRVLFLEVATCNLICFMFGYHVHQKAILVSHLFILLNLVNYNWNIGSKRKRLAELSSLSALTGAASCMTLLFTPQENVIKVLLFILYYLLAFRSYHAFVSDLAFFYLLAVGIVPEFRNYKIALATNSVLLAFINLFLLIYITFYLENEEVVLLDEEESAELKQ